MISLADVQRQIRNAVVTGEMTPAASLFVGGGDPVARLAIHRRHYATSLVTALMGRFPATGWLVGSRMLEDAAATFVRQYPPTAPCIAEYGQAFPDFLTRQPGADRVPYLQAFADLDWHLGRLAVAIDSPPVEHAAWVGVPSGAVADAFVTLQPGTHYVHADWPIDEIFVAWLANSAPAGLRRLRLADAPVWIEARGARGSFRFNRMTEGEFAFRVALWSGASLGQAAERAIDIDPTCDPARALSSLIEARIVTSLQFRESGAQL